MRYVSPQVVELLGVKVVSAERDEAVSILEHRAETREPTRVAFLNANLSLLAAKDRSLHRLLQGFTIFNDGVGLQLARKILLGSAFPANLNGTDFIPYFLSEARRDLTLFLLGAKPETLERAAAAIRLRWPRHTIVGQESGFYEKADEPALLSRILASRPDVVLVAMGNPKQELWIAENVPRYCLCAIGVGAWFDFVAEVVPRAPTYVRAMRLEWFYRLLQEPRRLWRRYLVGNLHFLFLVLRRRLRKVYASG